MATFCMRWIVVFGVVGDDMLLCIGQWYARQLCMFCIEIGLDDHSHVHIIANFKFLLVEGLRITFDNVISVIYVHCGFEVVVVFQGS